MPLMRSIDMRNGLSFPLTKRSRLPQALLRVTKSSAEGSVGSARQGGHDSGLQWMLRELGGISIPEVRAIVLPELGQLSLASIEGGRPGVTLSAVASGSEGLFRLVATDPEHNDGRLCFIKPS